MPGRKAARGHALFRNSLECGHGARKMAYYLRQVPGIQPQIWSIDDFVAIRMGVTNPESGPGSYFKAEAGETVWDTMKRQAPDWFEPAGSEPFQKTVLEPGQFYPRIARPWFGRPSDFPRIPLMRPSDNNFIAVARSQLTALMQQLAFICQTVHPSEDTLHTYGHSIRNLLILACTEVEMHWRGVLVANKVIQSEYTTKHYVRLQPAMKLGDYAIGFPSFPWLAPARPFEGWGISRNPSQDLRWYASYNAVKHNREHEFQRATLHNVFEAVSACAIMMIAQFGSIIGLGKNTELESFFYLSSSPRWRLTDAYMPPFRETTGESLEVSYPFDVSPS